MPGTSGKPRASLKSRVIAGTALGLIALGIWLGSFFRGPGLGGSAGTGDGATDSTSEGGNAPQQTSTDREDVPIDAVSTTVDPRTPLTSGGSTTSGGTDVAGNADAVTVMIYGDGYRLPLDSSVDSTALAAPVSDHFRSATLEEVIAASRLAAGNEQGIHVIVLRHKTAKVSAGTALQKALENAGFRGGQIHVRDDQFFE
ncbi:MAG: hypothetical protein R3B90_05160 [Planctomycetaceae bacterium]